MHDMLKRKRICKEKKNKKNQNAFKYGLLGSKSLEQLANCEHKLI